ncbi:MAG: VanZ family protein [Thermoanaerobaculia bacterium]
MLLTLLFAAVSLGTLAVAPIIWFRILPHLQPHVTLWYVLAGVLGAALLGIWACGAGARNRLLASGLLAVVLLLYVGLLFLYYRGEPPAKKFHLLEYGVLAGLTLQAVRIDGWRGKGPLVAVLFLLAVGSADETAQGFIPMRTFRWLDLFANYIGSALGALAWVAASPHSPWRRPDAPRTGERP